MRWQGAREQPYMHARQACSVLHSWGGSQKVLPPVDGRDAASTRAAALRLLLAGWAGLVQHALDLVLQAPEEAGLEGLDLQQLSDGSLQPGCGCRPLGPQHGLGPQQLAHGWSCMAGKQVLQAGWFPAWQSEGGVVPQQGHRRLVLAVHQQACTQVRQHELLEEAVWNIRQMHRLCAGRHIF